MYRNGELFFYGAKYEHGCFSNFFPSRIVIGGVVYSSVEHYYQSRKAVVTEVRNWIANAPRPYYAFRAGRALRKEDMIEHWDSVKVAVMRRALKEKYELKFFRDALLETGDAPIHEDSPSDMFWGCRGKDMLGKLLEEIRGEIRGAE